MQYKIWGARGSLPKPETPQQRRAFLRDVLHRYKQESAQTPDIDTFLNHQPRSQMDGYGGNTSCYEVRDGSLSLIIDGGSGIKELGVELMQGPCGRGEGESHIFLTHFHWDHLIGLPFFLPLFVPGNRVHFYAVQEELETVVRQLFSKPYFPVDFDWLGSSIYFHRLEPRKKIQVGNLSLAAYRLDHPDPCWGFKISDGKRAVAHCVDTEGTRVTQDELGPDLPLYENVDLMVYDAQYTLLEIVEKINWGHAVAGLGLDIAMRENIKKILFVHHDPYATDAKVMQAELQTRAYYDQRLKEAKISGEKLFPVDWCFAYEGLTLEV